MEDTLRDKRQQVDKMVREAQLQVELNKKKKQVQITSPREVKDRAEWVEKQLQLTTH